MDPVLKFELDRSVVQTEASTTDADRSLESRSMASSSSSECACADTPATGEVSGRSEEDANDENIAKIFDSCCYDTLRLFLDDSREVIIPEDEPSPRLEIVDDLRPRQGGPRDRQTGTSSLELRGRGTRPISGFGPQPWSDHHGFPVPGNKQPSNPIFALDCSTGLDDYCDFNHSGKCDPSSRYEQLDNAFTLAYHVCLAAQREMALWGSYEPYYWKHLWRARVKYETSTLEYWFGGAEHPHFQERFLTICEVTYWWLYRFKFGFYPWPKPVYFWCKPNSLIKKWAARHNTINSIILYKLWFERTGEFAANTQAMDVLHEMGHLSQLNRLFPLSVLGSLLGWAISSEVGLLGKLKDRKNPACTGTLNKCYSESPMKGDLYEGASIRKVVEKFENGDEAAYKDMINNIDNFLCWMWNRWKDRGGCIIKVN